MKGTHLARVTKAQQKGFKVPLENSRVETWFLTAPLEENLDVEVMYLALEGQVVIDIGLEFVHLRNGESVVIEAKKPHRLSPVGEAVVLCISSLKNLV
jgi:mannose-6-phosphate isomerase-like protein (cupin superfamily)